MPSVTMLTPGANVPLTANNPLLKEVLVGFGWDAIASNGPMPELTASAIMCDETNKAISQEHFVFFNQLAAPEADGAVVYNDDVDDEQIDVNFSLIPKNVVKIVFIVYVDPDLRKPGSFGSIRNAYIRVADRTGNDIARFNVPDNNTVSAMVFGELYMHRDAWKFRAIGEGFAGGLEDVRRNYGVAL